MRVIGKGKDAVDSLVLEVENLFDMTDKQREVVFRAIDLSTNPDEKDWTYETFYIMAELQYCQISGQPITSENSMDGEGNPDGGWIEAPGVQIRWQRGPIDPDDENGEPWNGAFLVTVLECARRQLGYYQSGKYACDSNAKALRQLDDVIFTLNGRQLERFIRGVRGQHEE